MLPLQVACSFRATRVYAAVAAMTPEAAPMKEQDIVYVAGATRRSVPTL
jgi:hypothetical protein